MLLPGALLTPSRRAGESGGAARALGLPPLWFALGLAWCTLAVAVGARLGLSLRGLGWLLAGADLPLLALRLLLFRRRPPARRSAHPAHPPSRRRRARAAAGLLLPLAILLAVAIAGGGLPASIDGWSSLADSRQALGAGPSQALGAGPSQALSAGPSQALSAGPSQALSAGSSQALSAGSNQALSAGVSDAWEVMVALLARLSGSDLVALYFRYLPPLLLVLALLAQYSLAREVTRREGLARLALWFLTFYALTDITRAYSGFGLALLGRLEEDKLLALFLLLPVAQTCFLRALRRRSAGELRCFAVVALAAIATQPMAAVWIALSTLPLALWWRPDRSPNQSPNQSPDRGPNGSWAAAAARRRILLFLCLVLLAGAIVAGTERAGKTETYAELTHPANAQMLRAATVQRHLLVLSLDPAIYLAHPALLSHPLVLLALVAALLLLFAGRRSLANRFLLAATAAMLLLAVTPLATLLGRLVTPWQVPRVLWALPVCLLLAAAVGEVQRLSRRLSRRERGVAARRLTLVAAGALIVAVGAAAPRLAPSWRSLRLWNGDVLPAAEREVAATIAHQGREGDAALVPQPLALHLPALIAGVRVYPDRLHGFRPGQLADADQLQILQLLDRRAVALLDRYLVTLVVVGAGSAVDEQMAAMPDLFTPLCRGPELALYRRPLGPPPPDAAALVEANDHLEEGDFPAAERVLQRELGMDPEGLGVTLGLGRVFEATGRPGEAKRFYRFAGRGKELPPALLLRWAELSIAEAARPGPSPSRRRRSAASPPSPQARQDRPSRPARRARLASRAVGRLTRALARADCAVGLVDRVAATTVRLPPAARASAAGRRLDEAVAACLDRRIAAEPADEERYLAAARTTQALGDPERASTLYRLAARRFPERTSALLALAELERARGDPAAAEAALTTALARQPLPPDGAVDLAWSRLLRGRGDPAGARAWAQRALAVAAEPFSAAVAWLELGEVRSTLGDAAGARLAYRRAAELLPEDSVIEEALAWSLWSGGEEAEARQRFERAAALPPPREGPWVALAVLRRQAGDDAGSDLALARAVALAADPGATTRRVARLALDHHLDELALAAFERALAAAPGDLVAAAGVLRCRAALGRPRAADAFDAALAGSPPAASQVLEAGALLIEARDWPPLVRLYEWALAHGVEAPRIDLELGDVEKILGHGERAVWLYRRAAALAPDAPEVRQRLAGAAPPSAAPAAPSPEP